MLEENGPVNLHPTAEPAVQLGSGIYVDVENIKGNAQAFISSLLDTWPAIPKPAQLSLYVRADHSDLWSMWAESQFPHLAVKAKGIQHFSNDAGKNSADIAIAIDALADFLNQRVAWVAVVSDDSDFISLYSKIRDEWVAMGHQPGNVPFLWIVTNRPRTRSLFMQEFFPNSHVHTVHYLQKSDNLDQPAAAPPANNGHNAAANKVLMDMAQAIIEQIPVGKFKSTDCHKIIRRGWPTHALAKANGQSFGVEFRKDLWDILKTRGVIEPNPNRQPRRYEMPQSAKATLG